MPEITGSLAVALVIIVALNAYALLAGADFGGGVWDLLATGPRREQQRRLIAEAIGPVWEANHVWLILVVVLLFTCFPAAFALLAIRLHIPLSLMLIGIVLRGSAFIFRSYDSKRDAVQRRWGSVFAVASLITPLLLGTMIGTVASGRLLRYGDGTEGFLRAFVTPWLTPFALAVGVFALCLFAFLAAVYLTVEARERALREDYRHRALGAGVAVFVAAVGALLLSSHDEAGAPLMWHGLVHSGWALLLHAATGVAAVTALGALWWRSYYLARVAAAAQVSLILWGWAVAQFPYLVPPDLTVTSAAAPAVTLRLTLIILAIGAVFFLPSLFYLFRVFKTGRPGPVSDH
ncbi:MAG: cytochrome d ubiquinol oxidase subunit II [Gemmatimonadota bacterium]